MEKIERHIQPVNLIEAGKLQPPMTPKIGITSKSEQDKDQDSLIHQMTVAAIQMAEKKVRAHRSVPVEMRRRSLSPPNMRSTRFRRR